jgi:HD-GYP domain-containing protein (c-di-GMP phosphodiesterase class II)
VDVAVAELLANAGQQFDPRLVEALLEVIDEGGAEAADLMERSEPAGLGAANRKALDPSPISP